MDLWGLTFNLQPSSSLEAGLNVLMLLVCGQFSGVTGQFDHDNWVA
jgi:hypothetical protein